MDRPQRGEVEQAGHGDDVVRVDVELAQQQLQHVLAHRVGDLEPHRRPEPAAGQLAFERLQEVLVAVLLDLDVGVAGDAERVHLGDLHAGEQLAQVRGDQVLDGQEDRPRGSSVATFTRRGTLLGTFTRANRSVRPSGSRTVTARLSESPEM